MNFEFSELSTTGNLPERLTEWSDDKFKMHVCSRALSDWACVMAGGVPPENFENGMAKAASLLGVPGTPDSFMGYAKKQL